ncbi:ABC transporter substrate-binding protein [Marinitenerispora sediminis]|uniref:Sugar ABC transporter substrate-binding protein n=1 Tax=Marinitenerispora sediminis TaxID=1931232 RepID=A0A368T6P1_9ACTN|nr:ABC transporter substrate-binding protein [Marinitenerispora sediminis]RCV52309.1 sugar ABC transporter substrate-binding protein [Marinitenerispora sediminis]RCV58849.1 sugar ABC transporter substrate-binding protein [Marinitenerispora sediminis]RCV59367.1 sugar ABC transporter substrate-binding protein [Marinitenerispora sediminis]
MSLLPPRRLTLAAALPLVLLAGGCSYLEGGSTAADPDSADCEPFREWQDTEGGTVNVYASIRDVEADRLESAWADFASCTGIDIQYEGTGEFEAQIQVMVDGGNAPDLAFFPQPGLLERFASAGDLLPLPDPVREQAEAGFSEDWLNYTTVDGEMYGVPLGANVKSFVWYSPSYFADNGYEVPETWDDMIELSDAIVEAGDKPWCAGIESGDATGWPATDWVENVMLRENGPDVYDQWVSHEIPFDDEAVVDALDRVDTILRNPDYVNGGYGDVQSIATTAFQEAGLPILENQCAMHMMGSFYAANWPEGTEVGEDGDVFAFNMPPIDPEIGTPVLGGGEFVGAFSDRPEVVAFQEYLATAGFADSRASEGAWISAHQDLDLDTLQAPTDRLGAEVLRDPDAVFRFDGADIMPAAVGAGTFWRGMVNWINGDSTEETLTYIEDSWPSS